MNTEINFQKECSNQCKKKKIQQKNQPKKTRGSANTFLVDKKSLLERKIHKIIKMIIKIRDCTTVFVIICDVKIAMRQLN